MIFLLKQLDFPDGISTSLQDFSIVKATLGLEREKKRVKPITNIKETKRLGITSPSP